MPLCLEELMMEELMMEELMIEELHRQKQEEEFLCEPDWEGLDRQRREDEDCYELDWEELDRQRREDEDCYEPDWEELDRQRREDEECYEPDFEESFWSVQLFRCQKGARPAKRAKICTSPMCFLPCSLFAISPGHYEKAGFLKMGDKVLDTSGQQIEVVHFRKLPCQKADIVELRTREVTNSFSACHRIVMRDGNTRLAAQLEPGVEVLSGNRSEPLVKMLRHTRATELFEIGFNPDSPVEAAMLLQRNIATKGHLALDDTLDTEMAFGSPDPDNVSIPDTECSYD